ncbi:hypothetical protein CYMTET_44562 [Cymbomonas tetramitiformis]|uniref:Uncharacterized protein n=1 Tax=Cymbomonas tetramitiformis TaxID=36881 RepID=A0AAE0EZG0_9CHLO|nr:hypothetical protein CYMTET_44562 [Cymbomonas tetramitiformis]
MGKKRNALVGRICHLFKDDWPQYSDVCPEIGYWTGKILDYCPKKDPANPYKCLIVENGEDSEFWYFSFERIKARVVLLEGEIREDIRQDNRKRRSSGRNLFLHSIAGGSRVRTAAFVGSASAPSEAEHQLSDVDVTPTKVAVLTQALPAAREETVSTAVHTTPQKRRAEDKSKWGRIKKRVA